jgi:transposase-like protein
MSRRYADHHKSAVLKQLEANGYDVAITSDQTGIPTRTLRAWRQELLSQLPPPPLRQRQPGELPRFESDLEAFAYLRRTILSEMIRISALVAEDGLVVAPHQTVNILSQLLDKFILLDEQWRFYKPPLLLFPPFTIDNDDDDIDHDNDDNDIVDDRDDTEDTVE